jgi:hypothetical protein
LTEDPAITTSPRATLTGIGQIGITITNLDTATALYRDTLGLNYLLSASGMAFSQLGELRLILGQASVSQPRQRASLMFYRVADIDAAYAALRGKGAH